MAISIKLIEATHNPTSIAVGGGNEKRNKRKRRKRCGTVERKKR
jgi:hypothetical protein